MLLSFLRYLDPGRDYRFNWTYHDAKVTADTSIGFKLWMIIDDLDRLMSAIPAGDEAALTANALTGFWKMLSI